MVARTLEQWAINEDMGFVSAIAADLFEDGTTNWGRITSLIAFGAALSLRFAEIGREDCVELVGKAMSLYLLTAQKAWLVRNNSWVSGCIAEQC